MLSRLLLILGILLCAACAGEQPRGPVVLAASSLQPALQQVADAWTAQGHPPPVIAFAGTPALARQVQGGAPADIVFFADELWMDALEGQDQLSPGSRRALLGNTLVLVTPSSDKRFRISADPRAALIALGDGRLAMADPDSVPAGRYGEAALRSMGVWELVEGKVVPTENVRASLALVERGEAAMGLVYASDAAATSSALHSLPLPTAAQPPIRYPAALLAGSRHSDARAFLDFLASEEAASIFARSGFPRLTKR